MKFVSGMVLVALCYIIVASFTPPKTNERGSCASVLMQLQGAKEQWAAEYATNSHAFTPQPAAIALFLKNSAMPRCPMGGTYNLGKTIGDKPTCSIPGHTL